MIRVRPPLPPSPLGARAEAAAVALTDQAVVIWGGVDPDWRPLGDGALLHLDPPAWETIPDTPLVSRAGAGVAAAQGKVFVWGGVGRNDGAVYDSARMRWLELPTVTLEARVNHAVKAFGTELLVWGGDDGTTAPPGPRALLDGGRLDLAAGKWSRLPPFPLLWRAFPSRVWCGDQLVVWGGVDHVADGAPGRAEARPARRPPDVAPSAERQDAALYDVASDSWTVLSPPPAMSTPARAVAASGRIVLLGLDGSVIEWEPLSGRTSAGAEFPASVGALAAPGVLTSVVDDHVIVLVPEGEHLRAWSGRTVHGATKGSSTFPGGLARRSLSPNGSS